MDMGLVLRVLQLSDSNFSTWAPTCSKLCPCDLWDYSNKKESVKERAKSGKDLLFKIYAKLSKENFLDRGNIVAMGLRACEVMRSSIPLCRINLLANGLKFWWSSILLTCQWLS
ncbi:Zinc finger CCCH domain-containing protein [Quillaja saponaria]|uniref:Zinc finger CCCH domain-containing protein n=1 Tax=Quillaja saponaria TaxID=32244 RepID=A0AAD7P6Q6_QUISA|nr:Zinc finger CCCH domain-containing protein [Quillaja saponaria]